MVVTEESQPVPSYPNKKAKLDKTKMTIENTKSDKYRAKQGKIVEKSHDIILVEKVFGIELVSL